MSTTSNPVTEGGGHRYLVGGQRTNSKKRKTRDKLNATQDQGQTQSNTSPGTNSKQHKTRDKLKATQDQGITTPDQRWALCVCTRGRVQGPPPMCVPWPMTKDHPPHHPVTGWGYPTVTFGGQKAKPSYVSKCGEGDPCQRPATFGLMCLHEGHGAPPPPCVCRGQERKP